MTNLPFFEKARHGNINFKEDSRDESWLFFLFGFFILIFFIVLLIRLFQLTIVKGNYYRRLSEENRIREIIIEPKRGKILDRKGFVIAESTNPDINQRKERIDSHRLYQFSETTAHLTGYRQIADQKDLKNDNCLRKLKLGDKIGKKGVEKIFDCDLRGNPGKKLIEVDAQGRFLKTISIINPEDGKTIQLALDLELQKKATELLSNKKGAILAIRPKTGEILALVSSPNFSPQDFEDNNLEQVNKYLTDKNKVLFNRATEGVYPPGSIFKLVLATAALEEKAIDEKKTFEDTGTIKAGPITFGNWYFLQYGKTEGMVDLLKAIRRSNDIYFYKIGELLGPEKIRTWSEKFGYGQKTGFGLEEAEGTIPSPFWKEDVIKDKWYLGDTYNLSIGQGYLLATPLQVTSAMAVFANNGYLCKPELLKTDSSSCKKLSISQKTIDLIREGMRQACSPGGTGWPLFEFRIKNSELRIEDEKKATESANLKTIHTACKTGTAESQGKLTTPHAWFTVFAPYDRPEIVLTVLVEEGGQGSDVAGPIAKEILKAYFERTE